jgi:hypothetical protein
VVVGAGAKKASSKRRFLGAILIIKGATLFETFVLYKMALFTAAQFADDHDRPVGVSGAPAHPGDAVTLALSDAGHRRV